MPENAVIEKGDVVARVAVKNTSTGPQVQFHLSRLAIDDLRDSAVWYRREDLGPLRETLRAVERAFAQRSRSRTTKSK